MYKAKILWIDDEVDFLKPHIIFLEDKGYNIATSNNGADGIDMVLEDNFDLVLLDENMPGLGGLEVLEQLKKAKPTLPVVMITKNEEEGVMDEAIGAKIADYLLKPISPKQVLLVIKKQLDSKQLVALQTTSNYQREFTELAMQINDCCTFDDWVEVYKKLSYWELELHDSRIDEMEEILHMQRTEANRLFSRFVKNNYLDWVSGHSQDAPITSASVFKEKLFPNLQDGEKCVVLLLDNLRYDQWRWMYEKVISSYYRLEEETVFTSVLPTTTQYSRNAMFAGLMPRDIDDIMPDYWVNDNEEDGKNLFEDKLLQRQAERYASGKILGYEKIISNKSAVNLCDNIMQVVQLQDISVIVYNFIDILSHSRTENKTLRDLTKNEREYRDILRSWLQNSFLLKLIKKLSEQKIKLVITTDHGCVRVNKYQLVQGFKETNTNLRYKQGKHLKYDPKKFFAITNPAEAKLPQVNISSHYVFALENDFIAYPNNLNHYVGYYKDTFQHGGISMEEMLIPFAILEPK